MIHFIYISIIILILIAALIIIMVICRKVVIGFEHYLEFEHGLHEEQIEQEVDAFGTYFNAANVRKPHQKKKLTPIRNIIKFKPNR